MTQAIDTVTPDDDATDKAIAGRSPWADARQRFLHNKAAVLALLVLCLVGLFACFGSRLAQFSNEEIDFMVIGQVAELGGPSLETGHYFGTDELGA